MTLQGMYNHPMKGLDTIVKSVKKYFFVKTGLYRHIRSIHEGIRYNCQKCEKIFSGKSGLSRHIRSIHEGIIFRYNCQMCDKTFANTENLTTHVNSIHGGTIYNCGKCDKAYNLKSNLSRHIKASHEGKKYVCKLCDKTFSGQSYLKNHDRSYHKGFTHKYQCEKCGKNLTSNTNLRKHIVAFHDDDEFKDFPNQVSKTSECDKCGKSLKRGGLRRHQELHTMNEEGLKFHCKECNGKYTCRSNFSRHLRTVHANKTIEPVIVLEEFRDLPSKVKNQVSNISQKTTVHEDQKSNVKHCKDLPKPKKGMWIVKLKRLHRTDF